MKKKFRSVSMLLTGVLTLFMFFSLVLTSCGGSNKQAEESNKVDDEEFYATQPLHSGLYDADYYDITGNNPRKGRFDGRIYFSLSPETSALYVFENGNRTKIDCVVPLQHPFEKGDSGVYYTVDTKERPVTLNTDSSMYVVGFHYSGDDVKITFNPKPRHTGTALEILERMNSQKNKNN